jgi:hypothetical protein
LLRVGLDYVAQTVEAADIGLGMLDRIDAVIADQDGRKLGVGPEELGEDIAVIPELALLGVVRRDEFGKAPGDLALMGEGVIVEILAHVAGAGCFAGQGVTEGLFRHVVPFAIGLHIVDHAQIGLEQGRAVQLFLELFVEPGKEPLGLGLLAGIGLFGGLRVLCSRLGRHRVGRCRGFGGIVGRRAGGHQGQAGRADQKAAKTHNG